MFSLTNGWAVWSSISQGEYEIISDSHRHKINGLSTPNKWMLSLCSLRSLHSISIFHPWQSEPKRGHILSQQELLRLFHWPQLTLFWPYFLWNNSPGSFTVVSLQRSSSLTADTSIWSLWGEWHNALYGISWSLEFHEPLKCGLQTQWSGRFQCIPDKTILKKRRQAWKN